jgi:O-antigen ligase
MRLLKILSILLILVFPIAEIGRIQFSNGVAISLNDIFLGGLIAAWVVYICRKSEKISKGELFKPIAGFLAIALASLLLNLFNLSFDRFLISFLYLARWAAYALLYFIFKDFDAKFKIRVSYAMLFSGSIVVLLGFIQYFFYPSLRNLYYLGWDEHLYRIFSSFLDPNFAGAFFAIFLIFSISFIPNLVKKRKWLSFSVVGIVGALTLGALYLTYSRSALIMLIVSTITYLFLINKKKFIFLILFGLLLSIFVLPRSFKSEGTNFLRAASSEARIKTTSEALIIIQKSPIYGVGFNAYRYARNQQGMNGLSWQVSHGAAGTDNSFLFVLATTGVIGFTAYLWLIYKIFKLGIINLKKNKFSIVLVSVVAGLIFNSLFINSLFYVLILEWIWIMTAFTESN